jgi:hypothetical protein
VQLVHDAAQAQPVGRGRVASVVAATCIALTGCGGGSASSTTVSKPPPNLGIDVRLATCADWSKGSKPNRIGTLREIQQFAGGPVGSPAGRGSVLREDQAYRLFQNTCGHAYARYFKLYKLYTRAAAFRGH